MDWNRIHPFFTRSSPLLLRSPNDRVVIWSCWRFEWINESSHRYPMYYAASACRETKDTRACRREKKKGRQKKAWWLLVTALHAKTLRIRSSGAQKRKVVIPFKIVDINETWAPRPGRWLIQQVETDVPLFQIVILTSCSLPSPDDDEDPRVLLSFCEVDSFIIVAPSEKRRKRRNEKWFGLETLRLMWWCCVEPSGEDEQALFLVWS